MKEVVAALIVGCFSSLLMTSCGPATPPPKASLPSAPQEPVAPPVPPVAGQNLPDPVPPSQVQECKRQDPELKVSVLSFRGGFSFDQPSFWVGNKRVGVREAAGSAAEEAAAHAKAQFRCTADGHFYVMVFPQRYIEPLPLKKGFRAGFGLFLHDNGDLAKQWPDNGLSFATEAGAACDLCPDLWHITVLGD